MMHMKYLAQSLVCCIFNEDFLRAFEQPDPTSESDEQSLHFITHCPEAGTLPLNTMRQRNHPVRTDTQPARRQGMDQCPELRLGSECL